MDAGRTKSWLIEHRNDPQWRWHYDYAFAKRPAEELYDLRTDPDQMRNRAADPAYAATLKAQSGELMRILAEAGDPRVVEKECRFDLPPFVETTKQR